MTNAHIPSTWRRLSARGLDQLFILPFYIPFMSSIWKLMVTDDAVVVPLGTALIYLLIPALYDFIFLVLLQGSPGKWFFDIKVVPIHDSGAKLSLGQCAMRSIVGIFSLFFGWAIYATAFFRYDRTHVVDWVAETRVVQAVPRLKRPTIRWLLGLLVIFFVGLDSLSTAKSVLQNVDWENRKLDLRALMEGSSGAEAFRQYEEEFGEAE